MDRIPGWSHFVPEGDGIDWSAVERALGWMVKYTCCAGCENGGGPPDCAIRSCARERGYGLCSSCDDLDSCTKFDRLMDAGPHMKAMLKENRGRSKEEYIRAIDDRLP